MSKAKIIGSAPRLVVADVVKTAEYYRDVLGFAIVGYFLDPPVYAMVERDGFQIHFGKSPNADIVTNNTLRNDLADFILWIPEIDAFYEEVKSRGAETAEGIVTRIYGSREFVIRDCDGHKILIGD